MYMYSLCIERERAYLQTDKPIISRRDLRAVLVAGEEHLHLTAR